MVYKEHMLKLKEKERNRTVIKGIDEIKVIYI